MKKISLITLIILIFMGCSKKDSDTIYYTTYDYRLFIKNNRIIESDFLVNDTVSGRTKYYFSDTLVKVVHYGQDTTNQKNYTLYKIGENGYAESSIEYPESNEVIYSDTFFTSRKHYAYNSTNQLIRVLCEYHNPVDSGLHSLYSYTYNGSNITGYSSSNFTQDCSYHIRYVCSGIPAKFDSKNNGILGIASTYLIK